MILPQQTLIHIKTVLKLLKKAIKNQCKAYLHWFSKTFLPIT